MADRFHRLREAVAEALQPIGNMVDYHERVRLILTRQNNYRAATDPHTIKALLDAYDAASGVAPVEAPSWAEVAQWLHAAYDRPPQTPEVRAMLARVDAVAAGVRGIDSTTFPPSPTDAAGITSLKGRA